LEHPATTARCIAERSFLRSLEGGCQVPIGVNTLVEDDQLTLTGMVATLDGQTLIKNQVTGAVMAAEQLGQDLAVALCEQGARTILDEIFEMVGRDGLRQVLQQQTE
jgi:hydroxymethylbilane synthase